MFTQSKDDSNVKSTKVNIKPLSCAKYYRLWTVRFKTHLQELGLWNAELKEPEPFDSEVSNNLILSLVSDNLLEQVLDGNLLASTVWNHFKKLYLVSSVSAQVVSLSSLINFAYPEPTMIENKQHLLSLARELRTAFKNASEISVDDLIMLFALVNLPIDYHSLRSTLQETNNSGLKFEDLFESLKKH
jgi:hypothetical protein